MVAGRRPAAEAVAVLTRTDVDAHNGRMESNLPTGAAVARASAVNGCIVENVVNNIILR